MTSAISVQAKAQPTELTSQLRADHFVGLKALFSLLL